MSGLLLSLNINSRNIKYLLNGIFLNDSGRTQIATNLIDNITVFGKGIFGDRVLLNGAYPHNIILEMLYQYGIIFGSILVIGLLIIGIRGYSLASGNLKLFLKLLFITGVLKLFISGSYLSFEPQFYMFFCFLY